MSFYNRAASVCSTEKASFPNLDGRIAMTAAEIAEAYPDGITIIQFGYWKSGELIPVIFAEDDNHFHWAGKVLSNIIHEWMCGFDSAEQASEELAAEGGVKVKLHVGKNKKGQACTYVNIVPKED